MMKQELNDNRLRNVIDYEIAYHRIAFKNELNNKNKELSEKNDEIKRLKAILEQHGLDY